MPTIPFLTNTLVVGSSYFYDYDLVAGNWVLKTNNGTINGVDVDGREIGTSAAPRGCALRVLDIRRRSSPHPNTDFNDYFIDIDVSIDYPDGVDDLSWQSMVANVEIKSGPYIYQHAVRCFRPNLGVVWDAARENAYNIESRKHAILDGHTATWAGGEWGVCYDCPLQKLVFDWGDGQTEERALVTRTVNETSVGKPANFGDLSAPVSHVFTPDADNNGSGNPVSVRAVDGWGRRSVVRQTNVAPEAKCTISIDEATGDFLFDTSASYGRTGKINSRAVQSLNVATAFTPDLKLDAKGRVFRVPFVVAGRARFEVSIADASSGGVYTFLRTYAPPLYPTISVERPPNSSVYLADGSVLWAFEGGFFGSGLTNFQRKPRRFIAQGQTGFSWLFGVPGVRALLPDVTAPRLARSGAFLFLAGRHKSSETRLYRSDDQARTWSELAMIWTPEFFHADLELLTGGGACSVALKRVAIDATHYKLECWFRKTRALGNWESEPIKVAEISASTSLDETLIAFPEILNEALAGLSNRLIVAVSNYNLFFESIETGAAGSWRSVSP